MGKSIKKATKLVKNPIAAIGGGALVGGGGGALTGGLTSALTGGMNGLFSEKTKKYKKDPLAAGINNLGKMGVASLAAGGMELDKIYSNPDKTISNQIGIENKLMRGASEDAARRARDLIAQRGMGASSIGLGQEINLGKQLNDKLAMNNASKMNRLIDINKERLNLGNTLLAPKLGQGPLQMKTIKQRTGGITGQGGLLDRITPFAGAIGKAFGSMG
jgi:hypothetical protein